MRHIYTIGRARSIAAAEDSPVSTICSSCVAKNRGDFNACVDKGKCEMPNGT